MGTSDIKARTTRRGKVVHVSSVHSWTDNRVHYRECESLAAAGFDVTLVAVASPVESHLGATRVIALPRRGRVARMLVGAPLAVVTALRTGSRIFHLHDPELIPFIPLLRALGKKVVYDAHEDLPRQLEHKPYLKGWVRRAASLAAHVLVRAACLADHVVAATEVVGARFSTRNVTVIHNYPALLVDEEALKPVLERDATAIYVGALGWSRGLRTMALLPSAPSFPPGWGVTIVGPIGQEMRHEAINLGGARPASVVGPLPPADARREMANARVGLVLLQPTPAYIDSLPTKMFEYFAAGTPVIASDFPAWRGIVRDGECGILVRPDDPEAAAAALRRYADDPELLDAHSRNARRLAETRYNWSSEAAVLVRLYDQLS